MKLPQVQLFDANFEGLLREAAAAPRSMLLRVDRPQVFPALRSRESPASVAMAGLTSVERELLASYRAELGFLLRQATVVRLLRDEATCRWIDPITSSGKPHRVITMSQCVTQARQLLTTAPACALSTFVSAHTRAVDLLRRKSPVASPSELAVVALRFEPVDQSRIYASAHMTSVGEVSRGIDVLRTVLDGQACAENEAFAHEWTALILARRGEFTEATCSMNTATNLGLPRPELPMRYLLYSALSGDRARIEDAKRRVLDLVAPDDSSISHVCSAITQQVRRGVWQLTRASRDSLRKLGRSSDPVSARILNAITRQSNSSQ